LSRLPRSQSKAESDLQAALARLPRTGNGHLGFLLRSCRRYSKQGLGLRLQATLSSQRTHTRAKAENHQLRPWHSRCGTSSSGIQDIKHGLAAPLKRPDERNSFRYQGISYVYNKVNFEVHNVERDSFRIIVSHSYHVTSIKTCYTSVKQLYWISRFGERNVQMRV